MRVADVVGKKIVAVEQERLNDLEWGHRWIINEIVLDNGTRIVFHAEETIDTPCVTASVVKPTKKQKEGLKP